MKLVKVAAGVLNTTPLDWDGNTRCILSAIEEARRREVSLLCLPELCITGYGCEDAFHSPGVVTMAWRVLREILPATRGLVVSVGLPVPYGNGLFNCAAMIADGTLLGLVAKRFLCGDGIHYEPRWFKQWPAGAVSQVSIDGITCPVGDIHFDVCGIKIGFEICEDAWAARRPGADLAREGADVIFNPSASHFAFGKHEIRKRFVLEGSRAFGVTYVYSNLVGNEAGRAIYDGGALIATAGRLVSAGPRFSFRDHLLTTAVVDVEQTRALRAKTASFSPDFADQRSCIATPFEYPQTSPKAPSTPEPGWESSRDVKEEEFARAVSLGLFDYLRKSRSDGFIVSLSGGADSSAVACLVHLMAHFAVAELGTTALRMKLSYLRGFDTVGSGNLNAAQALTRRLLACVYQPTFNSSDTTRNAARQVAGAIAAEYLEFDVEEIKNAYVSLVSRAIDRKLTWETDDIALQNIQARARGPGVWMLANLRNALLLATSNRSEAAVGYATMDGIDTCGGLSPIAGIDKNFLRRWLKWMEQTGPEGAGNLPALAAVNRQVPTAELRPKEAGQTDEQDLMPYDLLDAVERCAIRDKQVPVEVFELMSVQFPQYTPQQLGFWVERFFTLWCRNQWKRERYAPSFHLDDENLDPKTWCRFPILSGSFQRELDELRRHVSGLREPNPTGAPPELSSQ